MIREIKNKITQLMMSSDNILATIAVNPLVRSLPECSHTRMDRLTLLD